MSRVLIGNLPPGTTIRNIDDFCSPFGRLLYVDVKNQGNSTMLACVEYENSRNANNLVRARHGNNFNGYTVQLKVMSSGDSSGGFEVRGGGDSRRQNLQKNSPPPPLWSKTNNASANNRGFNNNVGMQQSSNSNFDNRGNNNSYNNDSYSGNNTNNRGGPLPSMDSGSLDFNQACRIVYERFINEGFNPQLAKEKTLEFVTNMQGGNNQGFNSNSDYLGQSRNSNNFGNNFNNQDWNGGNNFQGNQQQFPNSNWGNFNGPNNQDTPYWGGGSGSGGMSYPVGGNYSGYMDDMPSTSNWNSGRNRNDSNPGRNRNDSNPGRTVYRGGRQDPVVVPVEHDRYIQSLGIRRKIEAKITKGTSTPRDLINYQFHTKIIEDYQLYNKTNRVDTPRAVKKTPEEEEKMLQRYKSAMGLVKKLKPDLGKLSPEDKKNYLRNKSIVDEYERYVASGKARGAQRSIAAAPGKKNQSSTAAAYERKKQQLLKEAKKNYPNEFRLSGAGKKKLRSLLTAGVDPNDAKMLALHPSDVIKTLITLKSSVKAPTVANGGDKSKQLVAVGSKKPVNPEDGKISEMTRKERDGMRSANKLIFKYENKSTEIDQLTERDIVLLRISLKRLRAYNEKYKINLRVTKYDELLSEKYDKIEETRRQQKANEAAQKMEGVETAETTQDQAKVQKAGGEKAEVTANEDAEKEDEEANGDEAEAEENE